MLIVTTQNSTYRIEVSLPPFFVITKLKGDGGYWLKAGEQGLVKHIGLGIGASAFFDSVRTSPVRSITEEP